MFKIRLKKKDDWEGVRFIHNDMEYTIRDRHFDMIDKSVIFYTIYDKNNIKVNSNYSLKHLEIAKQTGEIKIIKDV